MISLQASFLVLLLAVAGCQGTFTTAATTSVAPPMSAPPSPVAAVTDEAVPSEQNKCSLPTYVIEPPDILLIDAVKIVPKAPHKIDVFDVLAVRVEGTLVDQPIAGGYSVDPEGKIDLGPAYGTVTVINQTVDEARVAIERHLKQLLENPEASVSLAASAGAQRIAGEHLVGPDGTVNLGTYGMVYVTGLTLPQAQQAIERQLGRYLEDPEVTVDVFSYNSKVFYVITEGAGFGDNVVRRPITGNETVLDAVADIGGLSQLSSKKMWISRPAPGNVGCEQILPINWDELTRGAVTTTNYQLLPGDRLFIAEDKMVKLDSIVSKVTRPFERIFGFSLLGTQMVGRMNQLPNVSNNSNF
jgi:polysaccharide export outer membrane protein